MPYIVFKEKFHGVMQPGIFVRKGTRMEVKVWNSMTTRDHIYVLKTSDKLPKGAKKTKNRGVWKMAKMPVKHKRTQRRYSNNNPFLNPNKALRNLGFSSY